MRFSDSLIVVKHILAHVIDENRAATARVGALLELDGKHESNFSVRKFRLERELDLEVKIFRRFSGASRKKVSAMDYNFVAKE